MTMYPSYPDHRMAYHLDGTQVYQADASGNVTQLTQSEVTYLNDEADLTSIETNLVSLTFVFPQLRDLTNYFTSWSTNYGYGYGTGMYVSSDTTNGIDGTWSTVINPYIGSPLSKPYYINSISPGVASGVKAVKFGVGRPYGAWNIRLYAIHLFGTLTSGETPNRLELWHPTSNARVSASHFDFGDRNRSTITDISFRVKNQSSTQTANSIAVSMATLTDLSPAAIGYYTLNLNGGSFASSQTISSLAPGAISNILTLRLTNPSNAALSLWAGTIKALAATWS